MKDCRNSSLFFLNFKSMRKFDHWLSNKRERIQFIATTKGPLILIGGHAKCDSKNLASLTKH